MPEEEPSTGEWAVTDSQLDDYLDLEPVDGVGGLDFDQPTLGIPLSPEQQAQVEADKLNNIPSIDDLQEEGEGEQSTEEPNLISQLLEARGIKDGLVKIEDEDGTVVDVPFSELTPEEQFNILNSNDDSPELDDLEQQTIKFLRDNNVTFEQAIDYFAKKAVADAIAANTANESVSGYSDDEIYAFDLISKFKDLTEDEIKIELEKQREHPELFKKKVDALREEYLQLEKDQATQKEEAEAQAQELEFKKVADSLVQVAREVEYIGGLDIEITDKQEVLGFILNKDVNGVTEFGKLLDDPKQLFEIAWYAKKGKEAFDTIHDYYRKEIAEASKKGYEKGKAEATPEPKKPSTLSNTVRNKPNNQVGKTNQPAIPPVEDLYKDLYNN